MRQGKTIGLFAYGEMGYTAFKSLQKEFRISWIIAQKEKNPYSQFPSVIDIAKKNNCKIYTVTSQKEIYDIVKNDTPTAIVIATYDKVLQKETLQLTKFINIHVGNLPKNRGRANANWAIINNKKNTAIAIHNVDPNLDAGNVFKQITIPILQQDTIADVYKKINKAIEININNVVKRVIAGDKGKSQKGIATYCCSRVPEDGLIDWNKPSMEIYNLIRAISKPYPGAFTYFLNKKMIIWEAEIPKDLKKYEGRIPGRICDINKDGSVDVLTKDSIIRIRKVLYKKKEDLPAAFIKSIKISLGINIVELFEKVFGNEN